MSRHCLDGRDSRDSEASPILGRASVQPLARGFMVSSATFFGPPGFDPRLGLLGSSFGCPFLRLEDRHVARGRALQQLRHLRGRTPQVGVLVQTRYVHVGGRLRRCWDTSGTQRPAPGDGTVHGTGGR